MSPLSKKVVRLKARLSSGSVTYPGFVESFSKNDVFISATPAMKKRDSTPGKSIALEFKSPCGKEVNVNCKIKWSYKTPPAGLTNIVAEWAGAELIGKPLKLRR